MQTNSTYIRVLASALSSSYGVKVIESDVWAFDAANKVLKYNPVTLLEKNIDVVRGLLIHEIGHVVHTTPVPSSQIYKDYPVINLIYNAFEDIRIEHALRSDYGGFAGAPLMTKNVVYIGDFFKENELKKSGKAFQVGAVAVMVDLMMQFVTGEGYHYGGTYEFDKFVRQIQNIESKLHQYVDEDVHEASQEIQRKQDWRKLRQMAQQAGSFGDIQQLVDKKVFPYVKHLLEQDPANEAMKQQMQQMIEKMKMEAQGSGEGEDGEEPEIMAGVDPSQQTEEPGTGTQSSSPVPYKTPSYTEASALVSPYTNFLASRIKDIMKENASIKYHGNHRHGRLMSRNVTKIALGETRVFSKRNQVDSPVYHLIVALDASGSMNGEKELNAYLGMVMAVDTFRKIRMKSTVIEFGDDVRVLLDGQKADRRFFDYSSQGGGTDDAAMVDWVYNYMTRNKDEEFLFIVIGDGQGQRLPQDKLRYIDENSTALAVGIGRGSEKVAQAYPGGVYVPDVPKVPSVILNRLHEAIHR